MDFVGFFPDERAGVSSAKMKRKEVDDAVDDFSEFSLCSPARKIRRLDLGLSISFQGEESPIPQVVAPSHDSHKQLPVILEAKASFPRNQEMAIVPYKSVHLPQSLPKSVDISFKMNPNWVSEFNSRNFESGYSNLVANYEDESSSSSREVSSNTCLAVVPWSPSQLPEAANGVELVPNSSSEEMDIEHDASMDVEHDASMDVEEQQMMTGHVFTSTGQFGVDQVQKQWQHHCIDRLVTPSQPTPAMWSW